MDLADRVAHKPHIYGHLDEGEEGLYRVGDDSMVYEA